MKELLLNNDLFIFKFLQLQNILSIFSLPVVSNDSTPNDCNLEHPESILYILIIFFVLKVEIFKFSNDEHPENISLELLQILK